MDGVVLMGLLQVVGISLVPVAICLVLLHLSDAWDWVREHGPWATPPAAPRHPLEGIAADLRRLYPGVHSPAPGTRMAKQRGVVLAYDDHLVEAAKALGVVTTLRDLDVNGFDREAERLRIEVTLLEAGLQLRP